MSSASLDFYLILKIYNLSANGDTYEGEWQDNRMQGKGVYKFSSGALYKGDFYNNQRHGEGEYLL